MKPALDTCRRCEDVRVRLKGSVLGVDACEVVTNGEQIVVGSDLHCDLRVADPLVARRAVKLRHMKRHLGVNDSCRSHWVVEAAPGMRVFLNQRLVRRSRIHFGDVLTIGCHDIRFSEAKTDPRNRSTTVQVQDLCARLIASGLVPGAFLSACPSSRDRRRTRLAARWGLACAAVMALVFLLIPRTEKFDQVQPPLEVVMVSPRTQAPSPDAVRSLEEVERQQVEAAQAATPPAELEEAKPPSIDQVDSAPVVSDVLRENAPPTPMAIEPVPIDQGPALAALAPQTNQTVRPEMRRQPETLARSAPVRRLTVTEAADPARRASLGGLNVSLDNVRPAGYRTYAHEVARPVQSPTAVNLSDTSQQRMAMLEKFKPSQLNFEIHNGSRIPVAHMPEQLIALDVPTDEQGIELDGQVTDAEIAASWKSGQFRLHGPAPTPATPETFCYVSTKNVGGKEFFYVSFVCRDPNPSLIRTGNAEGVYRDDSVEIFLDVNLNRVDYYHLIINTNAQFQARYCANGEIGINNKGTPWAANAQIKTTINHQAQQWTCEALIPFDSLGGKPPKGSRWAVNFTRAFRGQGYPDSVYQNWFLVYKENTNYHHPELYGVFEW